MRKMSGHVTEMVIVVLRPEMSPTLDGVRREINLLHEMKGIGGEMVVHQVEGTTETETGIAVHQVTEILHGVVVHRLVMTDHQEVVGQVGVVEAAVETTGGGMTGLDVTTLTDVTGTQIGLHETMIVETATWTVVLQETEILTELRETVTSTAVIVIWTEDPVIEIMIDRHHVNVILTEVHGTAITNDVTEISTVRHETVTWTEIAAGKGTGILTDRVLEIVHGISTVLMIPMTVLHVILTTGLHASLTMTEGVMIVGSGTATVIEIEIGELKNVVHRLVMN